jgi:hypothetical protein
MLPSRSRRSISMSKRTSKPALPRIKEPPPLPSIDELIAECRAVGWDDLAKSMEKIRYLDSPEGQKALERRERRISRL